MNKILTVSSLEKVFSNKKPQLKQEEYSVFQNEVFHYQIACFSDSLFPFCCVEVQSDISEFITVRRVEEVPVRFAKSQKDSDDYLLRRDNESGLYPDLLREIRQGKELLSENLWSTFWVTVNHDETQIPTGKHEIKIVFRKDKEVFGTSIFTLHVLPALLPKTNLQYTNWIHYDCISTYHGVEVFSEQFYQIFNEYLKTAIAHGLTMLYTPLFTPPLDTQIGRERKTAQLVGVTVTQTDEYAFDFSKLAHFIENAQKFGVHCFELSHLATQWGAAYCPKIVAKKDGKEVKIFGWETRSDSEEYLAFLDAFFSEFRVFITENGYLDGIRFHISDEPLKEHLEKFVAIKNTIRKYFPDTIIMDATIGSLEFYKQGVIDCPVVATDVAYIFREENSLKWVYYCTTQGKEYVSNRFINMPSQRNRILGLQLYENGAEGFLHWAFNFYNSYLSLFPVNPYFTTDAGGSFQGGDCFVVYPTQNGVLESLRLEVFYDGINDYRALCLLESLYGKEFVMNVLHDEGVRGFKEYPRDAKWHLAFRAKINALIAEKI